MINISTVIAVCNNKGGVLKTSVAVNLAGELANRGHTVLIIDTEQQGDVTLSFGGNADDWEYTIYDVLTDALPPESAIETIHEKKRKKGRIDILPSNDDMVSLSFEVLGNRRKYPDPFYLMRSKIGSHVIEEYDYVIIDSPPAMDLTVANIFSFPEVNVLVPFQCEQYSRRSLVKTLQTIAGFKEEHNPSLNVLGVVATLYDSRTVLHNEVLQDVRQFGDQNNVKIFETVIPRSVRYASTIAYEGLPLTLTKPSNSTKDARDAYIELLDELQDELEGGKDIE